MWLGWGQSHFPASYYSQNDKKPQTENWFKVEREKQWPEKREVYVTIWGKVVCAEMNHDKCSDFLYEPLLAFPESISAWRRARVVQWTQRHRYVCRGCYQVRLCLPYNILSFVHFIINIIWNWINKLICCFGARLVVMGTALNFHLKDQNSWRGAALSTQWSRFHGLQQGKAWLS